MPITKLDKIKNLRNGITIGAIAAASLFASSPATAQTADIKNTTTEKAVSPKNKENEENILTLNPEDIRKPGENAVTNKEASEDFQAIAHLTNFAEWFKKSPGHPNEKYNEPLRIIPTLLFIPTPELSTLAAYEFKLGKPELSQLSLQDYQSVCVARNTSATAQKLMALYALGKTDEADAILPNFSKKFQDKIYISSINTSMNGEDYHKLHREISKNFEKIYPEFCQDTQKFWQQNHNFDLPEIKLNDNQFINIALTKYYSVTVPENLPKASETRKAYLEIVQRLQEKQNDKSANSSVKGKIQNLRQGKNSNEKKSEKELLNNFKTSWIALKKAIKEVKNAGR